MLSWICICVCRRWCAQLKKRLNFEIRTQDEQHSPTRLRIFSCVIQASTQKYSNPFDLPYDCCCRRAKVEQMDRILGHWIGGLIFYSIILAAKRSKINQPNQLPKKKKRGRSQNLVGLSEFSLWFQPSRTPKWLPCSFLHSVDFIVRLGTEFCKWNAFIFW